MKMYIHNKRKNLLLKILVGSTLSIIFILVGSRYLGGGVDWYDTFYPTGQAVLSGKSPYTLIGFRYVPWAILPILPFVWLPPDIGRAAFFVFSLLTFAYTAYRLGGKPITVGLFIISPPVMHCLFNANIDGITLLGFFMPPQIGLFFVLIKPQTTSALVLFWLIEAWRKNGMKEVFRVFAPVTIGIAFSFLLFGFWPERFLEPVSFGWNASLWPMSIPIGLVLLIKSIKNRSEYIAMSASPFLSPYVLLHSWSGALVSLVNSTTDMLAAVIGLWILMGIRMFEML